MYTYINFIYFRLKDGRLQSYAEKFKEIAAEVGDALEKITSFNVSTVSNSMLKEKNKTLKQLENRLKLTQSKLNGLPEIKNDLQEVVLQCEQVTVARIIIIIIC